MTEINWGIFRAKFDGKEQTSFQRLCYALFRFEFDRPLGVFAFKNQAGIESEPIHVDGDVIGFQAKFTTTAISDLKQELIGAVETAKRYNPTLTKILLYVNQEFGESTNPARKDPSYKLAIEDAARKTGVKVEWRVPSHLDAQLMAPENAHLAQHFFSFEKGAFDLLEELVQHTNSILAPIRTEIPFGDKLIKIDRANATRQLLDQTTSTRIFLFAGSAGVGKTAVLKDFVTQLEGQVPLYIFRATEFDIGHINELFAAYGDFTITAFVEAHSDQQDKYVVIDSAEKLSDIADRSAFQDFLSTMLRYGWKVVLTTRSGYLSDLQFLLVNTYGLEVRTAMISDLSIEELVALGAQYGFTLPTNERLQDLLRNPFYLGEYLRYYASLVTGVTYSAFRDMLWQRQVTKSEHRTQNLHRRREETFLSLAFQRANQGHMHVKSDGLDSEALARLEVDEIIGFDASARGYFITHDIYEEWALEKFIEGAFTVSPSPTKFLEQLGTSLAVRRAFRLWVTERLTNNSTDIHSLVTAVMSEYSLSAFWRDEVCVAALLSPYAQTFVQSFEARLLDENQPLLVRLIFLLRVACKDVDEAALGLLGVSGVSNTALKFIFTMPKGGGWAALIGFVYTHRQVLGLRLTNIVVPMLTDWTTKYKTGATTRHASLTALHYYQVLADHDSIHYSHHDDSTTELVKVVLNGATEIAAELSAIFEEALAIDHIGHGHPYYPLLQVLLSSPVESMEVAKCLPEYVHKLAAKCWQAPPEPAEWWRQGSHIGVEHDFGLAENHLEYHPASPFHTPTLALLQHAPLETIAFIVSFMNTAVEHYAASELANDSETVVLHLDESAPQEQVISHRLWCTYRGTQVSPYLLESIHMALERWLLGIGKTASTVELEGWCLALLCGSKSASLTAVVASLICAFPYKLFRVAAMLAKTKEYFWYDTARMVADQSHKSSLEGLQRSFPSSDRKFYEDERITACDDPHRKYSLESIMFKYQILQIEGESDADVEHRQEVLWAIWDQHYADLEGKEADEDAKSWRLLLARLDTRKMTPKREEIGGQQAITFHPDIDPDLKRYSEESLQKNAESMKYLNLRTWAYYRFQREAEQYRKFPQYEGDPTGVLQLVKEIVQGLRDQSAEQYFLFNHAIPAYACAVLLRDYFEQLSVDERKFCMDIVLEYAVVPVRAERYSYQVGDGIEPSVFTLPSLLPKFPEDKQTIEALMLRLLMNPYREVSGTLIWGIYHQLWHADFEAAHAMFVGFLLLKPAYEAARGEVRKEDIKKQRYQHSELRVMERFEARNRKLLKKAARHQLLYSDVGDLSTYDLGVLVGAFELLPVGMQHADHQHFIATLFRIVTPRLFERESYRDHPERDIYSLGRLREKIAYFVLGTQPAAIPQLIAPFVDGFRPSREAADLLSDFISAEDRLATYDAFWAVWTCFYPAVAAVASADRPAYDASSIIHNYLLAWPYWKKNARKWHSLRDREREFFRQAAEDMGRHPAVLDALAKLLNEIGSEFLRDGIGWISGILARHQVLETVKLEVNTLYYLENAVRRFTLLNHRDLKSSPQTRTQVLTILDFLVLRGSMVGYLLREEVL